MSLKVIGSGFGRTGTMSMKEALGVTGPWSVPPHVRSNGKSGAAFLLEDNCSR
jgi:hypothetical protein